MSLPKSLRGRLRLPVVGAPLFIISHPALVIAQCKAGIIGGFPALNARPIQQLDEWLHEITETLAAHDRAHTVIVTGGVRSFDSPLTSAFTLFYDENSDDTRRNLTYELDVAAIRGVRRGIKPQKCCRDCEEC